MDENAARGIELHPEALPYDESPQNNIPGNGEGILIGGEGGAASSYTNVYDNVISDVMARDDVRAPCFW